MDFSNQTKTTGKNAPTEKSQDFCLTFMNSMEDGRRNPGSRPWTFKTRENPGSRPSTFADCEYQLWSSSGGNEAADFREEYDIHRTFQADCMSLQRHTMYTIQY
jgi:hypothetical protein